MEAKILADSRTASGNRVTTFQLSMWRSTLAEFNTHRVFSRNAGSSRAIPTATLIDRVRNNPFMPVYWGKNQAGMQANVELTGEELAIAKLEWRKAAGLAADTAERLAAAHVHKQISNRILEPFLEVAVVATTNERGLSNFFALRCHKDAQPEIRELAMMMLDAFEKSTPRVLSRNQWHLPYILPSEYAEYGVSPTETRFDAIEPLIKVSVARCARVSYKAFDGTKASFEEDLKLYNRLLGAQPLHASPAEHQLSPDLKDFEGWVSPWLHGNINGWVQYRKMLNHEVVDNMTDARRIFASK